MRWCRAAAGSTCGSRWSCTRASGASRLPGQPDVGCATPSSAPASPASTPSRARPRSSAPSPSPVSTRTSARRRRRRTAVSHHRASRTRTASTAMTVGHHQPASRQRVRSASLSSTSCRPSWIHQEGGVQRRVRRRARSRPAASSTSPTRPISTRLTVLSIAPHPFRPGRAHVHRQRGRPGQPQAADRRRRAMASRSARTSSSSRKCETRADVGLGPAHPHPHRLHAGDLHGPVAQHHARPRPGADRRVRRCGCAASAGRRAGRAWRPSTISQRPRAAATPAPTSTQVSSRGRSASCRASSRRQPMAGRPARTAATS